MATYQYPTALELSQIEAVKLPRLTAQRPIFDIFPIRTVEDSYVAWEQSDVYTGLQQLRGMNGAPPVVSRIGLKRYVMEPGIYGEYSIIDERELTRRRQIGSLTAMIDATDLVMSEQDRLLGRRLDRIETIVWTLLATGTFSVSTATGSVAHTDSYTTQSFAAGTAWSTAATSTPLADFRSVALKARGYSVSFGAGSIAYMNQTTFNQLLSNTNNADLYGRRTSGFGTINSPDGLSQLLTSDNLPRIVVYDEGYLDSSGTFQLFIPNSKVIVVGRRPSGAPVGEYQMTRNANNPGLAPGAYTKVIDRGEDQVPRSIEVHDGHNGGPAMKFPSSVVVMSV